MSYFESPDVLFPLTESLFNEDSPSGPTDLDSIIPEPDFWSEASAESEGDWIIRGQSEKAERGSDDFASRVVDPTAALTSISFQNTYVPSFYGVPGSGNVFTFRPVIPMKVFGQNQILRVSAPYSINGPDGDGLQPTQII